MRMSLTGLVGGVTVAGRKISNLRFADDITLRAATEQEILDLLGKSNKVGFKINKCETKIMVID